MTTASGRHGVHDRVGLPGLPAGRGGVRLPVRCPLARSEQSDEELDRTDRLLDKLGASLEPFYGFRSLHAFKAKFAPRYEPIHLAFRDEADLPRIGVALTRAYLPDASPRQLLAAGLSARGEHADAGAR